MGSGLAAHNTAVEVALKQVDFYGHLAQARQIQQQGQPHILGVYLFAPVAAIDPQLGGSVAPVGVLQGDGKHVIGFGHRVGGGAEIGELNGSQIVAEIIQLARKLLQGLGSVGVEVFRVGQRLVDCPGQLLQGGQLWLAGEDWSGGRRPGVFPPRHY